MKKEPVSRKTRPNLVWYVIDPAKFPPEMQDKGSTRVPSTWTWFPHFPVFSGFAKTRDAELMQ
jgi:hypothetical protein